MSSWNSQSCLSSQNGEKRKIARLEVRSPFKIHHLHHFVWFVCETRAKILLSDPETSLTSPVASLLVEAMETIVWKPEIALVDVQIVSKFLEITGAIRTIIWKPGFTGKWIASHANVLRDSSRVPTPRERGIIAWRTRKNVRVGG